MKSVLICLLLTTGLISFAREERYTERLNGVTYNTSAVPITIEDDKFYEVLAGGTNFEVADVNCFLKLGIEEGITGTFQNVFDINVTFSVKGYTSPSSYTNLGPVTLHVSYDPASLAPNIQLASKRLNGYHKVEIAVTSIYNNITSSTTSTLPVNSYMELELVVDRYYTLDEDAVFDADFELDHELLASTNELSFYWNYIRGAEYYDLEWVHVNNYSSTGTAMAPSYVAFTESGFKYNSTRIRTSAEHYEIPLIFDKGYVVYRLRPVGIGDNDDANALLDNEIIGKWTTWTSLSGTTGDTRDQVIDFPHYAEINSEHEATINWQYQAVYAEEGKKKDVVTYYDGSLRSRQISTKLSSNDKVIVGETIYDSEGRPAVTILPVPTVTGPTATPDALGFHPEFNQNTSGLTYSLYDFDVSTSVDACGVTTPGALNDEGAGLYYGEGVAATGNWQDQVPDANGYPFVQVEYMPDNTGRIKRQSGVGNDYTIDSDHATRYFYTQPYQEELDRLFGTNAGYKSRYKKNVVMDANGQISVSYVDPFGRVVATALVGSEPDNVLALADGAGAPLSNPGSTIQVDLLAKVDAADTDTPEDQNHLYATGNFGALNDGLKFSTEQLVYQNNSDLKYKYTLNAGRFEYVCGETTLDYPYVFDLTIGLENDCGTNVYQTPVNNITIGAVTDAGNQSYTNDAIASSGAIKADDLPIGTYSNYKLLNVNMAAAEELAAQFIADGQAAGCIKTLAEFQELFQSQVDLTGCGMSCETCLETLGEDAEAYIDERKLDYDWESLSHGNQTTLTAQFEAEYEVLVEECNELCGVEISYCDVMRNQLLMDVSPHGQYGAVSGDMSMSVFNVNHLLPGNAAAIDWQHPAQDYVNSDGSPGRVYVTNSGGTWTPAHTGTILTEPGTGNLYVKPQQLTYLTDFMLEWDLNWAESLLPAHPEFCYLDGWCSASDFGYTETINGTAYTSEEIDNLMLSITTFDAAANVTELGAADLTDLADLIALDPFFGNTSTFLPGGLTTMFNNYYTFPGSSTINIWQFAIFLVNEGDNFGVIPSGTPPGDYTVDATNEDEVWNTFKMLYMSLKQEVYKEWAHNYAVESGCYNGCIGNATFDPYAYDFATTNGTTGLGGSTPGNILDEDLPCAFQNAGNFANKDPRFFGTNEALSDVFGDTPQELVDNVNLQTYAQTGLCPLANDLMIMLNGMAETNKFKTNHTLNGTPYFGVQLYAGFGGDINTDFSFGTSMVEDLDYSYTVSGTNNKTLNMAIENATPDNSCQDVILTLSQYGSVTPGNLSWDDYNTDWNIASFHSFYYVNQSPSGTYNFKVVAVVEDLVTPTNGPYEVLIEGSTCLMVGQCEVDGQSGSPSAGTVGAIQIPCSPTENGMALIQMFNYMLYDSSTTHYFFEDAYLPASDVAVLLDGNSFLNWYTSGNHSWNISNTGSQYTIEIIEQPSGDKYIIVIDDLPATVQGFLELTPFAAPDFSLKMVLDDGSIAYTTATIIFDPASGSNVNVALGDCGACSEPEIMTTSAVNDFIENLLEDEDAADIPGEVLAALGIEQYAATTSVVGPVVEGAQLRYGFDIDSDNDDDQVGTFIIYPIDGSTNLRSLSIDRYTALAPLTSEGNKTAGKEILQTNNEYVPIEIISPVPLTDCPCTDAPAEPITCADAYTDYLAQLPSGVNAVGSQAAFCALNYADYYQTFLTLVNSAINSGYTASSVNSHLGTPYAGNTSIDPFTVFVYSMENPESVEDLTYADYVAAVTAAGLDPISEAEFENTGNCALCKRSYTAYLGTGTPTLNIDEFCGTLPQNCQQDISINFDVWDDYTWEYENDCEEQLMNTANLNAIEAYNTYIEMVEAEFINNYVNSALADVVETFELQAPDNEYHYTLYYYDQAGNLVRTVPPGGVNKVASTYWDDIRAQRQAGPGTTNYGIYDPQHGYLTSYGYNALNQLVIQRTPDGGTSRFWYDALGRLVASQNQKQYTANQFSYTVFDELGRIVEVGELTANTSLLTGGLPTDPDAIFNDETYPDHFAAVVSGVIQRFEITRTYYDEPLIAVGGEVMNGRNRIGSVTYSEYYTVDEDEYQSAYHYQYDIHGNVAQMIQEIRREPTVAESGLTSTVNYTYDLVSGNVLEVAYNAGRVDQFYHHYEYDADNRITRTLTSEDGINFRSDAKYFYYDHGPLARTEIGHEKVQGTDYVYTAQGWIKSVNGVKIDAQNIDMAKDSYQNTNNLNSNTGTDAFGYALTYYTGDYEARTTGADQFMGDLSAIAPVNNLYNGNIAQMATALTDQSQTAVGLIANNYEYDQLNRIKHAESYVSGTLASYNYTAATNGKYEEEFTFDPNGNILYAQRKNNAGTVIDDFTYHYYDKTNAELSGSGTSNVYNQNTNMTNKLAYVNDAGSSSTDDLADQSSVNYEYDAIGQLTHDEQEEIETIEWTVTGKVKKITRSSGSTKADLEFLYDAMGNRIAKIVKPRTGGSPSNEVSWEFTFYTHDASGNVMAVYEKNNTLDGTELTETYKLAEQNIYGSSRLGLIIKDLTIAERVSTADNTGGFYDGNGYFKDISVSTLNMDYETEPSTLDLSVEVGNRRYELSNHLGNVLEVVSDQKICINSSGSISHYTSDVMQWGDYYAYGMSMDSRNGGEDYRFGYQGSESDPEVKGEGNSYTTYFRQLDVRIGRWLIRDPKVFAWESPYASMGNNPIILNDVNGDIVEPKGSQKNKKEYIRQQNEQANNITVDIKRGRLTFTYNEIQDKGETREATYDDLSLSERNLVDAISSEKTVEVNVNPNMINAFISDDFLSLDVQETKLLAYDPDILKLKKVILASHNAGLKNATYVESATEAPPYTAGEVLQMCLESEFQITFSESIPISKIFAVMDGSDPQSKNPNLPAYFIIYFGNDLDPSSGGIKPNGASIMIYSKENKAGVITKIVKPASESGFVRIFNSASQ